MPILARTASLLAHLAEESESVRSASSSPRKPRRRSSTGMADVERLTHGERRALDDAAYRAQLGYLLDRSPFYRHKLAASTPAAGSIGSPSCL